MNIQKFKITRRNKEFVKAIRKLVKAVKTDDLVLYAEIKEEFSQIGLQVGYNKDGDKVYIVSPGHPPLYFPCKEFE